MDVFRFKKIWSQQHCTSVTGYFHEINFRFNAKRLETNIRTEGISQLHENFQTSKYRKVNHQMTQNILDRQLEFFGYYYACFTTARQ